MPQSSDGMPASRRAPNCAGSSATTRQDGKEFRRRYLDELKEPRRRTIIEELAKLAAKRTVTLVYGARDEAHNHAIILRDVMNRVAARKTKSSRRKAWS